MKTLIIITLLLFPYPANHNQIRLTELELEVLADNPGYLDWSYDKQMKVKSIYTGKYSYRKIK